MIVRKEHGAEMENVLVMHFVAKTYANGSRRFTGVVTTTGSRSEFDLAVFNLVQPHIVHKGYRLEGKKTTSTFRLAVRRV